MKHSPIWQQAQSEEFNCWVQISHKLDSELYIARKKAYWQRILHKAGLTAESLDTHSIIEVGAGPSGIFLLFPNKPDFVTLDPLNDEYTRLAPHLYQQQTTIASPLETFVPEQTFDCVFAINCIDHSNDIELFVAKLAALCGVGGTAVLAVNCHQNRWSEWIWQRFQAILEPHHPYHFTEANYAKLLLPHFNIVRVRDIEADVIWINNETSDEKIPPPADVPMNLPRLSRGKQLWRALVSGRAPAVLFMRFLAMLGWPAHDFRGNGRSLYRHKLFILKPKL
jgi:SAM-dependent methyltransferase